MKRNWRYNAIPKQDQNRPTIPVRNLSSHTRPSQLIRVDVSENLFNLLFIRLVLVAVGDEELGAQEAGNVEDFHLLGLCEGVSGQTTSGKSLNPTNAYSRLQL